MSRTYLDESLGMITNANNLVPLETNVIETHLWNLLIQEALKETTF